MTENVDEHVGSIWLQVENDWKNSELLWEVQNRDSDLMRCSPSFFLFFMEFFS